MRKFRFNHISSIVLLTLLCYLCTCPTAHAADGVPQPGVQVEQSEGGHGVRYLLYLPTGYTDQKTWPLMVFLHGVGERGNDLEKVKVWGPPKLLGDTKAVLPVLKENFIVVSPQCPDNTFWYDNMTQVLAITDAVTKRFKGDPVHTYLTGLSMGGYGTWRIAAHTPGRWAAIAPVCGGLAPAYGGGTPEEIANIEMGLPIWTHHGSADPTVPYSDTVTIVKTLEAKGGAKFERVEFNHDAKGFLSQPRIFTTHTGAGHFIWGDVYDDPDTYKWLLQWSRH